MIQFIGDQVEPPYDQILTRPAGVTVMACHFVVLQRVADVGSDVETRTAPGSQVAPSRRKIRPNIC